MLTPSQEKPEPKQKKPRVNTAVYVTSIPLDATPAEIHQVFSRCGVIAEEIDSGAYRIKMYEDDKGQFKGEALVVYFRPESVNLAIQLLDDTDLRLGVEGPRGKMRVQAADYSYKKQQDAPVEPGGNRAPTRDRNKIIRKTQKLNRYGYPVLRLLTSRLSVFQANWQIGMMTIHQYYQRPTHDGIKWSY